LTSTTRQSILSEQQHSSRPHPDRLSIASIGNMFSLCFAVSMSLITASNALCVWDGTGCYDDGCDPVKRQEKCGEFESENLCKSAASYGDERCTWSEVAVGFVESKNRLIRAHDDIDLEPMRQCTECWECYACTHDEHYGLTGNCVPILGCEPSACAYDGDCGDGRSCVSGSCKECAVDSDCSGARSCYYGQCRDPCVEAKDCTSYASGDMCEHGFCVCSGSNC